MFIIGERKLLKTLRMAQKTGMAEAIPFKRGGIFGKVILEPYEGVIGVTVSIRCRTIAEIVEENYTDVVEDITNINTVKAIQDELPRLYRLCEIGLYIKFEIWENTLPPETTIEQIQDYFNISDKQLQEAHIEESTHGKVKVSVNGTYYGERRITLLQSKKTKYIRNIIDIK